MEITNDSLLTQLLMTATTEALMEATEYIQDNLKINMWNEIYSKPSSTYYKRSAQMMKSVIKPMVKTSGNTISTIVGIDVDAVEQNIGAIGEFNSHMNTSTKKDPYTWRGTLVNRAVFVWYDEGTSNAYYPSVPQTDFWFNVMGDRLTEPNPNYDKALKVFEDSLMRNLGKFGQVIITKQI